MKFLHLVTILLFNIFFVNALSAQATDTLQQKKDSINRAIKDSLLTQKSNAPTGWALDSRQPLTLQILKHHNWYNYNNKPIVISSNIRKWPANDMMFYVVALLVLLFAVLKNMFAKYFAGIYRFIFQASINKQQITDQVLQNALPSLLFNIFFITTTGLFLIFLVQHFKIFHIKNFWLLYLYISLLLAIVYFIKYVAFLFFGWLFNLKETFNRYIFVVFLVNKLIGIALLPVVVFLAFTKGGLHQAAMYVSFVMLMVLIAYRFFLGISMINNRVKLHLFHFIIFLLAVELIPVLLLYKSAFRLY